MESTVDTGRVETNRPVERRPAKRVGGLARAADRRGRRSKWRASGARPFLHRLRRPLAIVLLVLGCLAVPVSVVAVWTRTQLMNTDAYVAMVAPLADDPAIQTRWRTG